MASSFEKSFGSTSVWGFSPALDLLSFSDKCGREKDINDVVKEKLVEPTTTEPSNEPYNILISCASDPRHIIKTLARSWRNNECGRRPLHFYIHEAQPPVLARILLLLWIFIEETEEISQQERAELFLEIYGNAMLREKSYNFVQDISKTLINLVTDQMEVPWLDASRLKFKERDDLEFTLNFWRSPNKQFEIQKMRDFRMRRLYEQRYDVRENLVDWDFNMKLVEKMPVLHKKEFSRWRENGIAFEVRDSSYNKPNKTMATVDGLKENGLTVSKWGYFSDIITGPFVSFNAYSEKKDFFQKKNGMLPYPSQCVAEYNICSYLHEFATHSFYTPEQPKQITQLDNTPDIKTPSFKITFLPCDPVQTFSKPKFKQFFDAAFLSNAIAHRTVDLQGILKQSGRAAIETARFMIDLRKEQMQHFSDKIIEMARTNGLRVMTKGPKPDGYVDELIFLDVIPREE